jgi:hypothetical protein
VSVAAPEVTVPPWMAVINTEPSGGGPRPLPGVAAASIGVASALVKLVAPSDAGGAMASELSAVAGSLPPWALPAATAALEAATVSLVEPAPPATAAGPVESVGTSIVAAGVETDGAATAKLAAAVDLDVLVSVEVALASSVDSIIAWVTAGAGAGTDTSSATTVVVVVVTVTVDDWTVAELVGELIIWLAESAPLIIWLEESPEPALVVLLETIPEFAPDAGTVAGGAAVAGAVVAGVVVPPVVVPPVVVPPVVVPSVVVAPVVVPVGSAAGRAPASAATWIRPCLPRLATVALPDVSAVAGVVGVTTGGGVPTGGVTGAVATEVETGGVGAAIGGVGAAVTSDTTGAFASALEAALLEPECEAW